MLIGVDIDRINQAMRNMRDNIKPKLPRVVATSMDMFGKFKVRFDEYIMLP